MQINSIHLKEDTPQKARSQRQVVLPLGKSVQIAINSIRSRFQRSFITTISLILAISFYSYVKTNSIVIDSLFNIDDTTMSEKLIRAGFPAPEPGEKYKGTARERWILFLSLLVCVVGIVNTQLMAVADRFREIGTMKCLGALNRFIWRLFLIEAVFQGLIGSFAGALVGTFIALSGSAIKYGIDAVLAIQFTQLLISIGSSVLLGCLLSVAGVSYPALLAAKMKPVEAMRGRD